MPTKNLGSQPGQSLRDARVAAGLSQEDVAHKLNLLVVNVDALEQNNYKAIAPIFIRGYIKSYSNLLELNTKILLEAADHRIKVAGEEQSEKRVTPVSGVKPHHRAIAVLSAAIIAWFIANRIFAPTPVETASDVSQFEVVAVKLANPLSEKMLEGIENSEILPLTYKGDVARLDIVLIRDCYLRLRTAEGEVIVDGLYESGQTLSLTAVAAVELLVSNSSSVNLSVNEQAFDLSQHVHNQPVRIQLRPI